VLIALALSAELGSWMGARVTRLLLPVVDGLLSSVDPFRINRMIATVLDPLHDSVPIFAVLVAPLLALGLIQTHRQFHGQKENRRFHLLRCLLPLFAVLGSSSLLLTTVFSLVAHTRGNELEIVREVHLAIETLSAPSSGTNTMPLQKFSLEDLAKSSQLSEKTKFALRGSTIIVRPDETRLDRHLPPIQWPFEYAFMAVGANGKRPLSYSALIRTPRGSECNLKFWASGFGQNGFLLESCQ
ncbi:MAG TPA: hypothetical protein VFP96_03915, partial [Candidatus Acidoferrum sp.]|nr:hypothetical protein [Candidatus Acidoferrum sp.]